MDAMYYCAMLRGIEVYIAYFHWIVLVKHRTEEEKMKQRVGSIENADK